MRRVSRKEMVKLFDGIDRSCERVTTGNVAHNMAGIRAAMGHIKTIVHAQLEWRDRRIAALQRDLRLSRSAGGRGPR